MESEDDVFYGFLKVLCPWAMRDPEVAAAVVTGRMDENIEFIV